MKNEKKVIFPSDKIGIEEEFRLGDGTYLDKDHNIRSALFGEKFIDKKNYRAKVFGKVKRPLIPQLDDKVIGVVNRVSKYSMLIQIHYINGKHVHPAYSAVMHITNLSNDYVEDIDDAYAVGDIIRANVIDAHTIPIQLETKDREEGVIFAWCGECGEASKKIGKNLLQCTSCGKEEKRKTSLDYGKSLFE